MRAYEVPTVNEIFYQRQSAIEIRRNNIVSTRPNRYKAGQYVRFVVDTLMRVGRISNAMCRNGVCTYHIETENGTWYREIAQDAIKGMVVMS